MTTDRAALEKALAAKTWTTFDNGSVLVTRGCLDLLRAAAQAHLDTLPRTKMVEVWHVEYVLERELPAVNVYRTRAEASEAARLFSDRITCVYVTGPHMHEVPA